MKPATRLWISNSLIRWLVSEANKTAPCETGGVILGYFSSQDVVVTHAIGPGQRANHGLYHFTPDYQFQEDEIARIYTESNRTTFYLGDWHTHPAGSEEMSGKDRTTLKTIAKSKAARLKCPIMMILSEETNWKMLAWQGVIDRPLGLIPHFEINPITIHPFD